MLPCPTHAEPLYIYMMILFGGIRSGVFSSRPQYGILGTGISGSNRFVRAPSSGGGSNAPRPALTFPHLDVNADGGSVRQARSVKNCTRYFERYSRVILRILMYMERLMKNNLARHYFQIGVIFRPKTNNTS